MRSVRAYTLVRPSRSDLTRPIVRLPYIPVSRRCCSTCLRLRVVCEGAMTSLVRALAERSRGSGEIAREKTSGKSTPLPLLPFGSTRFVESSNIFGFLCLFPPRFLSFVRSPYRRDEAVSGGWQRSRRNVHTYQVQRRASRLFLRKVSNEFLSPASNLADS